MDPAQGAVRLRLEYPTAGHPFRHEVTSLYETADPSIHLMHAFASLSPSNRGAVIHRFDHIDSTTSQMEDRVRRALTTAAASGKAELVWVKSVEIEVSPGLDFEK